MLSPHKRLQVYSFLFLLLVGLTLVFFLLRPFFNVIAGSFIITVLFSPLYSWFLKKIKMPTTSAVLTILIFLIILLGPLYLVGQMIFNEALDVYHSVKQDHILSGSEFVNGLPPNLRDLFLSVVDDVNKFLGTVTGNAFSAISGILSNIAGFFLSFFLMLFTVFYLLKDGHHIKAVLMDLSPIANAQENILSSRITSAVNGVVKGTFLVALAQGVVATFGFWIFGIPNPVLWGSVAVLTALVPTVGTAIAMIPAVGYLLLVGNLTGAVGLTVWGALAVGLIDNFLGPRIVGGVVRVHPVLVLFSILGGVSLFGFLGFLLGPILMAVFVAMVDMYRHDFKEYLEG